MKSENNLFGLIKNSNEKAFEILFRLYYKPLVDFCSKFFKDEDLAKGLIQQVFVNIWENRENLLDQAPSPYLYRSAKNQCLNYLRHQKVKNGFQSEEELIEPIEEIVIDEPNDRVLQIFNSIEKLPPQCKKIFIMSRMDGLSHKEIAEEMGLTVKTIKNQIVTALKHLRGDLAYLNIALIMCVIELFKNKF